MKSFKKFWPFFFILIVWIVLFWPFFRRGLLPFPADIIVGVYYPWLDYKWGYTVGVPVKNPLISDIPSILYPWRSLAIDELKSFRWPLWNPYYFAGMPLLANFQSAVFSYINVFFLFLPKALAWSAGVMISPLLTMLAMYVFLTHKKLGQLSSLLGSVVFSLSGFEIAWMEYNVHGHTALFLPLLLLSIDKILDDRNKTWLFFLPIFVAFQIFTGYIPVVIYSYIICFFYISFFYFLPQIKSKKIYWRKYVLVFFFWILGFLLAAIQILPGMELTRSSIRAIDPTVEASNASYLPLKNLVTALVPDFFGNPATGNYFGQAFYDNFYFLVGTGTLILVVFSIFFAKRKKEILFWWLIFGFSLIMVFKNPDGLWLEKLFFLSGGVAAKALFITDFSLAILAAYGMENFWLVGLKEKKKIILSISLIFVLFLLIVLLSFRIENSTHRLVAQRNLIIPAFFFIVCSLTLLSSSLRGVIPVKIPLKMSALIFILGVTSQLLYSAKKYLPFSKKELLFPKTPVLDFLLEKKKIENEPFRVELGEVIPQNFLMPYGLSTTSGYDALLPKKTGEFLSYLETGKVEEKISRVHLLKNYNSPLYPLTNTKYILVKKTDEKGMFSPSGKPPAQFRDTRFNLVFEDKTVQVYEDERFLPRAFWVHRFDVVESWDDFLGSETFPNFSNEIILDNETKFVVPQKKSLVNRIEWREDIPGKTVMVVESDQPGFVFLAESFFAGWKVFVDGVKSETKRANFAFRAVLVSEGRHLISWEYRPKSFLYGKAISFFAFLNLLIGISIFSASELWKKFS